MTSGYVTGNKLILSHNEINDANDEVRTLKIVLTLGRLSHKVRMDTLTMMKSGSLLTQKTK